MSSDTTQITIDLPNDVIAQIDARLPPEQIMTRAELVSLLVTLGLISSPTKIEVLTADQLSDFRQRKIDEAKTGLMEILRGYLNKVSHQPAIANMPTEVVIAMETVIGAAMGSGWASAAHAIQHYGAQPSDILAACKQIGLECNYSIEKL